MSTIPSKEFPLNDDELTYVTDENAQDPSYIPHRVFMNLVDRYNGKHIASYIADQYYGTSVQEEIEIAGEGQMIGEDVSPAKPEIEITGTRYEIIGTLSSPVAKKSEDILFITSPNSNRYKDEILKCGFFIFDISSDRNEIEKVSTIFSIIEAELERVKQVGPKTYNDYAEIRTFILISTVMTWTHTEALRRNKPFTELHYKKRKCHPDYKDHIACERNVTLKGRKYEGKLKTYIICSGFPYGYEEENLDFLFKMAWTNVNILPIFPTGDNNIPLIHIVDLAKILAQIMKTAPLNPQYILAVEENSSKLRDIVKAVSKELGTGRTKEVSSIEQALEFPCVTNSIYNKFTINLNMEPMFVTENLQLQWHSDFTFPRNIPNIVEEFKSSRNLKPLKIILHGPPGVGKTRLANKLCKVYGLHYISIATMIEETLDILKTNISDERARLKEKGKHVLEENVDEEVEEEEEEEEEDTAGDIEEWEEQIRDIQAGISQSENNKLPDEYVLRMIKKFLIQNLCQNRGYVIDNYPKTTEQAKELFGQGAESPEEAPGDEEAEKGGLGFLGNETSLLMPEFVFSLQATDEFLCNRIMQLQEKDIQGTRNTEENMMRRLAKFREENTEDNTVLNFFDEIEIHPILIDAMLDDTENMDHIFELVGKMVGSPITFAMTAEEEYELRLQKEKYHKQEEERAAIHKKATEERAIDEYKDKMSVWAETLEKLQMEEENIIVAENEPLREYLTAFVFPVLTKALLNLVKIKPEDPLDFVADYLFRENPEGKMFDPSYNSKGETLIKISEEVVSPAVADENQQLA